MPPRGDDVAFTGDNLGSWPDNDVDVRLDVGIARLANRGDTPVPDANIGLHNAPVIEN